MWVVPGGGAGGPASGVDVSVGGIHSLSGVPPAAHTFRDSASLAAIDCSMRAAISTGNPACSACNTTFADAITASLTTPTEHASNAAPCFSIATSAFLTVGSRAAHALTTDTSTTSIAILILVSMVKPPSTFSNGHRAEHMCQREPNHFQGKCQAHPTLANPRFHVPPKSRCVNPRQCHVWAVNRPRDRDSVVTLMRPHVCRAFHPGRLVPRCTWGFEIRTPR